MRPSRESRSAAAASNCCAAHQKSPSNSPTPDSVSTVQQQQLASNGGTRFSTHSPPLIQLSPALSPPPYDLRERPRRRQISSLELANDFVHRLTSAPGSPDDFLAKTPPPPPRKRRRISAASSASSSSTVNAAAAGEAAASAAAAAPAAAFVRPESSYGRSLWHHRAQQQQQQMLASASAAASWRPVATAYSVNANVGNVSSQRQSNSLSHQEGGSPPLPPPLQPLQPQSSSQLPPLLPIAYSYSEYGPTSNAGRFLYAAQFQHRPAAYHHLSNSYDLPAYLDQYASAPPQPQQHQPVLISLLGEESDYQLFQLHQQQLQQQQPSNLDSLLHLAAQVGVVGVSAGMTGGIRGADRQELDSRLPAYRFVPGDGRRRISGSHCVVCLADFEARQQLRGLACGHEFHSRCVDRWLKQNRTCPICRADAVTGRPQQLQHP